ncbi:MAG: hypothetical protein CMP67_09000 [Flavobacteriales bacterium]|nr:hypothetical protein [Flavobacteriales bacterium]|tara:strand:- start:810 stop:2657 length:1848 start_codon:yes stop_codon:yes gene_type:complete
MIKPNSLTKEQWFLLGIIAVASLLRFWRFWDFDYVHDELSALTRMNYASWSEFYHYGIELDGHPAGVHLFLKILYSIVGDNPFLIRLPFVICSVACVYQVYKFGKEWFSSSTGLISAACFSVVQYTIYQGVIARPYSPGLLFSLLLVRCWTKIFIQKSKDWKLFLLYGVLLSSLGYIHYFALLFGAAISLLGMLWLRKEILLKFLASGFIAFVLYIPHLSTFFFQLKTEGLEWLNPPDSKFLGNYLMYLFNHSKLFIGMVFLGTLYFLIKSIKEFVPLQIKKRTTLLCLFLIPFIVGYYYSIYISPVLQFSLLIFGFPCFLIWLFSFWNKSKIYVFSVPIILFIGVLSLVEERNHFNWFYQNPIGSFFKLCNQPKTLNVGRHEPLFYDFYKERFEEHFEYYSLDDDCTTIKEFQKLLQSSKYERVVMGDLFPREISLVNKYYPNVEMENRGNGYENLIFSKRKETLNDLYYKKRNLFSLSSVDKKNSFSKPFQLNIELNLDSILMNPHDIIDIYVELELESFDDSNIILVNEIKQGKEKIKWLGCNTKNLKPEDSNVFFLVNSYSIPFEKDSLSNLTLNGYVWNPDKTVFKVKNYGYGIREGNKNRFTGFNKLRD